jgi:triosephosphate isomerase (TIM)
VSPERELLISGNWKMHVNHFEAIRLVQELSAIFRAAPAPGDRAVSVHPPFTSLRTVQTALESDALPVALGAQNCHEADRGAYTGEVSAEMLAKLNVTYVIVGHSERRTYFGETDEDVRKKIDAVLRYNMAPIVCVGETSEERESGEAESKVRSQLEGALARRPGAVLARCVVAYEPLWAVGTGNNATADDAQAMAKHIRAELVRLGGAEADATRIQYGGSVTPDNAAELLACADVDGLLVGGASLDATRFTAIVAAGT